jgi:cell fate regulator YaaT (PSP1 superfamily)
MHVIGVAFKAKGKAYNFASEDTFEIGDKVIVETDRGVQLGIVATKDNVEYNKNLKEIISPATEEDYNKYLKNVKDAKKILLDTKELIKDMELNMSLIDASYSLDRKLLLFNFISDERVDFRNLVKELASRYHTRIELHQVGVRDKAKEIGGIGLCGRVLCCHGCLKNVNTVNINMVKNQNIALNPTKINGACGRLLCCFNYENEIYEENRKSLPKVGDKVKYNNKQVEVVEIDVLNKKYKVKLNDNTIEEVTVE